MFSGARARMDAVTSGKSSLVVWSCADQPKLVSPTSWNWHIPTELSACRTMMDVRAYSTRSPTLLVVTQVTEHLSVTGYFLQGSTEIITK
jgi:hypothetical protein